MKSATRRVFGVMKRGTKIFRLQSLQRRKIFRVEQNGLIKLFLFNT